MWASPPIDHDVHQWYLMMYPPWTKRRDEAAVRLLDEEAELPATKESYYQSTIKGTRVDKCIEYATAFCLFWIPSFLRGQANRPPSAIASLDGLRGYASFGVFALHFTDSFCQMHNRGWGFDENSHYFIQLPFVHFFWSANSLVACFFVISGYVLSHKPLRLIHSRSHDKFALTISSAIFRRGFRLYAPCFAATFLTVCLLQVGFFDLASIIYAEPGMVSGGESPPNKLATFSTQFWDWFHAMGDMTYLFRWNGTAPWYDPHLYTIPTEFQGSCALFFFTIGVAQLRHDVRLTADAAIIFYCGWHGNNEILLFFLGMIICDVDLLLRSSPRWETLQRHLRFIWIPCFVAGFFLVGMPSWDPQVTPGYMTLMWLIPDWYRWQTIGCGLLIWSVRNAEFIWIQSLFTNPFAQYLGNISFSLYIVHGNVRRSITYMLMPPLNQFFYGQDGDKGERVAMIAVNTVITFAVVFWLADVWWRGIDLPSIRIARWLEGKASRKQD